MTYIMLFHAPHVYLQKISLHVYFLFLNKLPSFETNMNHDLDKFRAWSIANKSTVNPN